VSVARDAIRSARERLGSVVRENANRTAFHRALALNQLAVDAEQQVVPLVERLKRVDSDNPDVRLVADDAAELFQSLSLRLNNDADDVTGAVVPLEQAERLAVSESAKQRIAENLRVVRGNMAARSARGLVGAIDLARALDAEAAVAAASAPPRERKRGFPWGWVWAAVVGLAVLSRLGPGGGSSGTAVTPTVRVDPNAAVRQQLTALQAEIDSARSDIANRESRINATEADIDSMKARLDSIESRYRATGAPPEVVREYDALRARFNAAVSEYNQELAAYKAKLADANRKVNEYNSLLRTAR